MSVKRASIFLIFFSAFFLLNCSKDTADPISDAAVEDVVDLDKDLPKICTELKVDNPARAFGHKRSFWNKSTLRVRFLGGSTYVQSKVKQYAVEWSRHANIQFEFVTSEPSDIRISFDTDSGSWSYVGRNNQYIAPNRATMNFGWFNNRTRESEFRRTTLHEFGHALGLSHEHQHPEVEIDWNRPAVYDYYKRTQDWSRSEVDGNIFRKYSAANSNFSDYDGSSIMHYYIPRSLVQGSWNPTWNTRLSATDIEFIRAIYPGTNTGVNTSCSCPEDRNILACADFESQTQATLAQSTTWKTWSEEAGHAELQAYSWGKVIKMQYSEVANPDIIYLPGLLSTGKYRLQWNMYVGEGSTAYFNVQKHKLPGQEFGVQCFFDTNETGRVEINNRRTTFEYRQVSWIEVSMIMDFTNDWITLSLNGQEVSSWPASWSARSERGTKQFAGINFYAVDAQSKFWLDEFCLSEEGSSARRHTLDHIAMASSKRAKITIKDH